ncbi:NADPH-dependent FMN reductase [Spirosoma sp.]|uniref:NADPH-dependent FMN reductase n=1 Tax=Spirosoma sp. TaxID=1899569 RepID=UPI002621120F|nr:NADPH-dependent FMN reductase [Spirosoma sp.]MCX6217981.1 NAD(P)H-dependent oxidoreductase [Spirosoma sp.]
MNFLAISGSLRTGSTNTALLRTMVTLAPKDVTVTLYETLDDLPHFSPEQDKEAVPEAVIKLRALLNTADAAIICTPEYIHGMPGVLKNMLDWMASSGDFVHKPVGVISAGPSDLGGSRAHASLAYTLGILMARLPENASLIVPFIKSRLAPNGDLIDPLLKQELQTVLTALVEAVEHKNQTL